MTLHILTPVSTAQFFHTVPQGTQSVNGSDVNIGCREKVRQVLSVKSCGGLTSPGTTYLTDGITPDINTSDSNWASQLVTVRKNNATLNIPYDHVVLVFDTLYSGNLTSVELDMFICPQWNIGAPNITVYADESGGSGYGYSALNDIITFSGTVTLSQSCYMTCTSLSSVKIPFQNIQPGALWYIVVRFEPNSDIEWVHIGEVRLLNEPTCKQTTITSSCV